MIVKKLKLENIRSYKEAVIDFPLGRTLFEGNIGCGKSTILMSIEFALFGLGSEKGGSLLRAGEKSGSVSLVFEVDGVEYLAHRKLKRERNSVQQDKKCELKSPEGVTVYTPGELKEKILEILDFNEPVDPKAQSVIYHYAVYTPQEEMKAILNFKPDVRMQTLRKAFRIEDYKTAGEHGKSFQSQIKSKTKILERLSETKKDLEKIEENKEKIRIAEEELALFEKQASENKQLLLDLKSKRDGLSDTQLSLSQSVGRLKGLEDQLKNNKDLATKAREQIESFQQRICEIEPKMQALKDEKDPSEKTLKQLKDEISETEQKYKQLLEKKTTIQVKVNDYGAIVEEGICPTCDRPADAKEFAPKIEGKKLELDSAIKSSEDCSKMLEQLRALFDRKREFENNQLTLAGYIKNLNEYRQSQLIWQTQLSEAEQAIESANAQLATVSADLEKLRQVTMQLEALKEEIEKAESEGNQIVGNVSGTKIRIEELKKQNNELEKQIHKKEEMKSKASKLNDYQIWMQDYFIPTLEIIEQQVMNRIKEDFDFQFQKWFNMLVDDAGKEARIDEEFTPLIQQDGMDQDVMYLSGGEKTSVALAYRLALNNIVGKVSAGAKSNLLILDEPTDGFSKEQLGKVREILDEIKNPQVILVSHETELESFADQVVKISKRNGESVIEENVT
jgi:exonuclease SbcC